MSDAQADAILSKLGATHAPVRRAGVQTAFEFFDRYMAAKSPTDRLGFLKAMDLSKAVRIVQLARGEHVVAFRYPAKDWGEFHSRVGADVTKLGVLTEGREHKRYEVVTPVAALESTTSAYLNIARGSGGGLQLVIPNASAVLRLLPTETHKR